MVGRRGAARPGLLLAALAIDLLAGEPPSGVHPVVWTGRGVDALTRRTPPSGARRQLVYGAGMTAAILATAGLAGAVTERWPRRLAGDAARAWLLKSTFAVRALLLAGEEVRQRLEAGRLDEARIGLRSLVSRETASLSEGQVAAAAIESLAENLTDGALAPWLAYAGWGLSGAAAYRALNTLDSMVGYRGRYEFLGKAAARGDDLANLLPARLGAILLALAAPAGGGSPRRAWRTALRDHRRTASPNAGWTMAAMAGALGVSLEKPGHYRLGEGREPEPSDIRRAQRIVGAALALGAGAVLGLAAMRQIVPGSRFHVPRCILPTMADSTHRGTWNLEPGTGGLGRATPRRTAD
jgi:adenosylcobinamide-phosphate synthase